MKSEVAIKRELVQIAEEKKHAEKGDNLWEASRLYGAACALLWALGRQEGLRKKIAPPSREFRVSEN